MYEKFVTLLHKAQEVAKAIVAGTGTVLTALIALEDDLGVSLIPDEAQPWVTLAVSLLTAFATWAVPNRVADPAAAAAALISEANRRNSI